MLHLPINLDLSPPFTISLMPTNPLESTRHTLSYPTMTGVLGSGDNLEVILGVIEGVMVDVVDFQRLLGLAHDHVVQKDHLLVNLGPGDDIALATIQIPLHTVLGHVPDTLRIHNGELALSIAASQMDVGLVAFDVVPHHTCK